MTGDSFGFGLRLRADKNRVDIAARDFAFLPDSLTEQRLKKSMRHQGKTGKSTLGGLFCALTLWITAAPAVQADVLTFYPFSNNSLASTDTNQLSTASAISLGGGLTDSTRFTANGNPGAALIVNTDETNGNTFATAITAGDFFMLTLTPASGDRFVFDSFTVDLATNSTTFTTNVRLQASINNSAFVDLNTVSAYSSTAYTTETFDLSGRNNNAAIAAGASVVLRVVVFDSDSTAGNYTAFDNITLNGTVAPIPEPGTVSLLILGAAAAGGVILRRRQR